MSNYRGKAAFREREIGFDDGFDNWAQNNKTLKRVLEI